MSYSRLNTKQILLKDPNANGTYIYLKTSALQKIITNMLNIIENKLFVGSKLTNPSPLKQKKAPNF